RPRGLWSTAFPPGVPETNLDSDRRLRWTTAPSVVLEMILDSDRRSDRRLRWTTAPSVVLAVLQRSDRPCWPARRTDAACRRHQSRLPAPRTRQRSTARRMSKRRPARGLRSAGGNARSPAGARPERWSILHSHWLGGGSRPADFVVPVGLRRRDRCRPSP